MQELKTPTNGLHNFAIMDLVGTTTIAAVLFAIGVPIVRLGAFTPREIIPTVMIQVLAFGAGMFIVFRRYKASIRSAGAYIGIGFSSAASWSLAWRWITVLILLMPIPIGFLSSNNLIVIATQPIFFSFFAGMVYAKCLWRLMPGMAHFFEKSLICDSKMFSWKELKMVAHATNGSNAAKVSFSIGESNSAMVLQVPNVIWNRFQRISLDRECVNTQSCKD